LELFPTVSADIGSAWSVERERISIRDTQT
jgi:hypothetical protein